MDRPGKDMADRSGEHQGFSRIAAQAHAHSHTVEEAVTGAIREAILTGVFLPGDRLRQEFLATELMTSRVPVVAALRTLEAEGLVEYLPHRGATVRILQPAEIEETYRLRILLETFAPVGDRADHSGRDRGTRRPCP